MNKSKKEFDRVMEEIEEEVLLLPITDSEIEQTLREAGMTAEEHAADCQRIVKRVERNSKNQKPSASQRKEGLPFHESQLH